MIYLTGLDCLQLVFCLLSTSFFSTFWYDGDDGDYDDDDGDGDDDDWSDDDGNNKGDDYESNNSLTSLI